MPARLRPSPSIPDHEVLRKIGGGSYGDVWLARGVTGAFRAVKVVWREDFEDQKSFEREFEGLLKFEPISRDHPGLVDILHVGRSSDADTFYYYVMELGDDVRTGSEINPVEYEPRTLRSDHQVGLAKCWDIAECVEVGLSLAEALNHLHMNGLAHRDVKPSNVIFVNGKAKLADIGLVAARGQRTFVGTEGFVPPEGPGSTQADVYSLGKVLYEMATGMDRMNFPDLPEKIPGSGDGKQWFELNRAICEVCDPRISKRKITTAAALADALRCIRTGKRRRPVIGVPTMAAIILAMLACFGTWMFFGKAWKLGGWSARESATKQQIGMLRIFSSPEGADVYDENGVFLGATPTQILKAKVGDSLKFTLRKNGYLPYQMEEIMTKDGVREPMAYAANLRVFSPPQTSESWTDQLGIAYEAVDGRHESAGYVNKWAWERYAENNNSNPAAAEFFRYTSNGERHEIVATSVEAANEFCEWLRSNAIKAGFLTDNYEVRALHEETFEHSDLSDTAREASLHPFRVMVRRVVNGGLLVASDPLGAEVFVGGKHAGIALEPLSVSDLKPGKIELQLFMEGYKPLNSIVEIKEGEVLRQTLKLEKNQSVVFGKKWENGLGMRFVPFGQDLMVCIWETRVLDYATYLNEVGKSVPTFVNIPQGDDHPAVNISRQDARDFCEWLTRSERKAGRISPLCTYRLPTDEEWSRFAGLNFEEGSSPASRDAQKPPVYPWGNEWSPTGESVGNFAGAEAAGSSSVARERTIEDYDDGYTHTAPVGMFAANRHGIFDLSGNVQEWVDDNYSSSGNDELGVLRGGGWNTWQKENLYTGSRNAVPPNYRDSIYGFRVVLAKSSAMGYPSNASQETFHGR